MQEKHEVNRFLIIRDAMQEASAVAFGNAASYSLMKALILADFAVEVMLSTLNSHFDNIVSDGAPTFKQLRQGLLSMNTDIEELAPLKSHNTGLNALHSTRNRTQHDGNVPSQHDVRKYVGTAENFLRAAFDSVFELDFDNLNLITFIRYPKAKRYLEKANHFISQNDFTEAAYQTSMAFSEGWAAFKVEIFEGNNSIEPIEVYPKARRLSTWGERVVARNMELMSPASSLELLVRPLELARLGINLNKAIAYFEKRPRIIRSDGATGFGKSGTDTYDEKQARRLVDFVADAIFQLQDYAAKQSGVANFLT